MSRIIAYCRVSTKTQNLDNQEHLILKYCQDNKLFIDEWIRISLSSGAKEYDRKINYLLESLKKDDVLIVSEISRLGRSSGAVISFIEKIVSIGVRIIAIKQNIDVSKETSNMSSKIIISLFSMMAEIEKDLISERTIMALERARADGKKLGRPKGKTGKSKLDGKEKEILHFIDHKVSIRAISRLLGCTDTCLRSFIKTRGLINK